MPSPSIAKTLRGQFRVADMEQADTSYACSFGTDVSHTGYKLYCYLHGYKVSGCVSTGFVDTRLEEFMPLLIEQALAQLATLACVRTLTRC